MAKDLLLEIGMEEIPARFVRGAAEQLREKTEKWLNEERISHTSVQAYATPRRIAVLVCDVAEKQADLREEARGPSKKIALDENGSWTKAAEGFARGQGVAPDSLFFREVNGVEYVFANKNSTGVATKTLLGEGLKSIVTSLSFPKNMRWGSYELRFVRPIRWIAALYGEDLVPLEITGVVSSRQTRGHRFLGKTVELAAPRDYVTRLREQFVYADIEERRQLILRQIEQLAEEKGWTVSIKDDLLEEVLFLVEYPTVLFGTFNPEFLHIPQEVLITSMREHQRYFPVMDDQGRLLPYFVTVRNGNTLSLDRVAKGNEKVLRARLSDARFFYQEDQKLSIDAALARLEKIVFHEQLGTIGDKVRRIRKISGNLAQSLQADVQTAALVERSAAICKFDLVTQMVYEFPELQGVMGEDYARKAGEPEMVARAVLEHYQPRFSGDAAPKSLAGAIVSIADKIDTIVGCFSLGIIPTGSQDPYALRRQAAGIVQILLDRRLTVGLNDLFDIAIRTHAQAGLLKREGDDIRIDLWEFFALRVKNLLAEREIRYDVADAVMAGGFAHIPSVLARAEALMAKVGSSSFKTVVEAFNRLGNLAAKAEGETNVDPDLLMEQEERGLFAAWERLSPRYSNYLASGEADHALDTASQLEEPITRFFEAVMVMAEDKRLRSNRLAMLNLISVGLRQFADFQKIVW